MQGFTSLSESEWVIYVAYGLIGLATYLVARALLAEQETRAASESLDELGDREASNKLIEVTRPFFDQYVVPIIRGKKFWDKKRKVFRRRIIAAGMKKELTPDEFIAFKLFLIFFFPLVLGLLKSGGFIDVTLMTILGSGVAGWFYPNLMVTQKINQRQNEIRKAMPFVVDLLALSTEAGLDFMGAMAKVVEKSNPSPIVDEFEQVLKEVKVGSSRAEALKEMGARVDMAEVNSFVAILISADSMGASIGRVLRQQSDSIRSARFTRAEKAGAAAASKVILPVVLFIMPAVFIMAMGPFILSAIYDR